MAEPLQIQSGMGTSYNLPNFVGQLFTASPRTTPLLSMIGGLNGGYSTTNTEFPTGQLFDYPAPKQPNISEQDSITAPTPSQIVRVQTKNVVQIHHDTVSLTYRKQAAFGRLQGINTAGMSATPVNEMGWQIQNRLLVPTAQDVEYSFINGTYQAVTSDTVPSKTRGMLELCKTAEGTAIDAAGAKLTYEMLQSFYLAMADNGAYFENMVMFVPARLKQLMSDIYSDRPGSNKPATRREAGIDITTVLTDFTTFDIVWNRFMPDNAVLMCDISYMAPVFLEVPGKGHFFVEALAKTGASDRNQLYGEVGLDHSPAFLHGSIYNIG